MRLFLPLLGTLLSGALLLLTCSDSTSNDNNNPQRVVWVAKSADSAAVESGIDAEAANLPPDFNRNGIFLQWHAVSDDDIRAYDIYRRDSDTLGAFPRIAAVQQPFGEKDTVYLDTEVELQTIYYYYVIARDEEGLTGEPSRKDHYTLLPEPSLNAPIGGQEFNGFFDWSDFFGQYFVFRLERQVGGNEYAPYFVKQYFTAGNVSPNQTWTLEELELNPLAPGTYRWRIDLVKLRNDREGAESKWEFFIVN